MRKIVYNYTKKMKDTQKLLEMLHLTEYICKEFNLYITIHDAYCMWRDVSIDAFHREWVNPEDLDYCIDKRVFIAFCLDNYCVFEEELMS